MVEKLVRALLLFPEVGQIIVTLNVHESLRLPADDRVQLICNVQPKGFGANHNAAFLCCDQPYFCPLNPDIEVGGNPFPALLHHLGAERAALAAPLICTPAGSLEDSVRHFPTVRSLCAKALGLSDGRHELGSGAAVFCPDWVAGMFMLFRSEDFRRLGGFDEAFFLYYEDVDICVRVWRAGMKVLACPDVSVIHDARRDSRRQWRYMRWHMTSAMRYFFKHWGRLPKVAA